MRRTDTYNLAACHPELVEEWGWEKNGDLTPEQLTPHSGEVVWWRCQYEHEWQASVCNRSKGRGCPYCSGYLPVFGINDLQTLYPEIAAQWHPEKNESLLPSQVAMRSNKIVWWMCEHGHEWQASVNNRVGHNQGCPFCLGRQAIPGENDLATLYPEIAAEWHPERNGDLLPSKTPAHSNKLIWWRCSEGHEWRTTANNRVNGRGCPYCSGRLAIPGVNDLETLFPQIAAEWHPDKNGTLTPSQVKPLAHKLVWWKCKEGHEWQAPVHNRTRGRGCPYCMGSRAIPGETDLETWYPDLAIQWCQERNGSLTPREVSCYSSYRVFWKCEQGHVWRAEIGNRVRFGSGCPICMGLVKCKM